MPYLAGAVAERPHETLFWRIDGMWAARQGDWKLVHAEAVPAPPELFNLAADVGEQRDLAATQPAKVKEMQALWDAWNAEQAPLDEPKDRTQRLEKPRPERGAADAEGKKRKKS